MVFSRVRTQNSLFLCKPFDKNKVSKTDIALTKDNERMLQLETHIFSQKEQNGYTHSYHQNDPQYIIS